MKIEAGNLFVHRRVCFLSLSIIQRQIKVVSQN